MSLKSVTDGRKQRNSISKELFIIISLQRRTDQDIVDYLQEKKIKIGRSTVTKIKNQVEQEAENWYIELRESITRPCVKETRPIV